MTIRGILAGWGIGVALATLGLGCEETPGSKAVDSSPSTTAPAVASVDLKARSAATSKVEIGPEIELIVSKDKAPRLAGRTAVPSLDEWNAVGEVTVKGSSALNCETKMVREWLRVSCSGKNDTGGTPTNITILSGGGPGTLHFNAAGVSSLVIPYVAGVEVKAVVSWTDKSQALKLSWPRGAPKPDVLGVFLGAKSPLDRPKAKLSKADLEFECQCERSGYGGMFPQDPGSKCEETVVSNVHCLHSYRGNCSSYYKCMIGEPGVPVTCPTGYHRYILNTCVKACGSTSDCDAGQKCTNLGGIQGCT